MEEQPNNNSTGAAKGRNRKRRAIRIAIWVATAIAFLYAEEDWRGNRAWNNYRKQLIARGAKLDFAAFVPGPIPDEENFAATPVVKSWFTEVNRAVVTNTTERFTNCWDDDYAKLTLMYPGGVQDNQSRHYMDLIECATIFEAIRNGRTNVTRQPDVEGMDMGARAAAAPAVLAGLKTNETMLAELQAASRRSLCRYPVVYDVENPWAIFLPHLLNVRNACQRLQLRACAELASGRSDEALADVKLMLYVADSVKGGPALVSYLVRAACVQLAMQPVWEGLAEHSWNDSQLQELERHLEGRNFVADLQEPLESEQAMGVRLADAVKKKGFGLFIELLGPGQPTVTDKRIADWGGTVIPGGWYALEKLNFMRFSQEQIEAAFDAQKKRIWPGQLDAKAQEVSRKLDSGRFQRTVFCVIHHMALVSALGDTLPKVLHRTATAQTTADQAAIACALERYRLASGSFPETLEALEPKFISQLPNDVITGATMKYRRTRDGRFVLYSVGWNEKDDGGTPGKELFDDKNGDWVWTYPAK